MTRDHRGDVTVRHVRKNLRTDQIISALGVIAQTDSTTGLSDAEQAVLAAVRRTTQALVEAPLSAIQDHLHRMPEAQSAGFVANVKGILHEMEFVRVDDAYRHLVYAAWFAATNHSDTDILLLDIATGESWAVQLTAMDSAASAEPWPDTLADDQMLVTRELAADMDLPTDRQPNEGLSTRAEDLVDGLVAGDDAGLEHLPVLSLLSTAKRIMHLWHRQRAGQISRSDFQHGCVDLAGERAARPVLTTLLLPIPVVGQAVGAYTVARLLWQVRAQMIRRG